MRRLIAAMTTLIVLSGCSQTSSIAGSVAAPRSNDQVRAKLQHNNASLCRDLSVTLCYTAYNNAGITFQKHGDLKDALFMESAAIVILTNYKTQIAANLPAPSQLDTAYDNRAAIYLQERKYALAAADANAALALSPNDPHAPDILVPADAIEHNFSQIESFTTQQIKMGHDLQKNYATRSMAEDDVGQFGQAISDATEAISIDPTDPFGYNFRGIAYLKSGNYDQSIADLTRAITLKSSNDTSPKTSGLYFLRGVAFDQEKKYSQAIADMTTTISLSPKDANAWNDRCWCRALSGDLQDALPDCHQALQIKPDFANAYDSRGFVYLRQHNFDAAIADYHAALAIDPRLASSLYGLGLAEQATGATGQGHADLFAAENIEPEIATEFGK